MVFHFWLVLTDVGGAYIRKNRPSLAEGEVGVPMTVNIPGAWFHRVTPVTTITIAEPAEPALDVTAGEPETSSVSGESEVQP